MASKKFHCANSVMLVSAETVANNMRANLPAFQMDYPGWTTERLDTFITEIDDARDMIGIKPSQLQQYATQKVADEATGLINNAATIKQQIERGYRKEPERMEAILSLLGFDKKWLKVRSRSQQALLDFVHTFNNNTDAALCSEMTAHDVSAVRIESIKNAADEFTLANVTQETLKSKTPVITAEMTARLNEIYDITIDICTAGKVVFRKDVARKAQFSFTKISAQHKPSTKIKQDGQD